MNSPPPPPPTEGLNIALIPKASEALKSVRWHVSPLPGPLMDMPLNLLLFWIFSTLSHAFFVYLLYSQQQGYTYNAQLERFPSYPFLCRKCHKVLSYATSGTVLINQFRKSYNWQGRRWDNIWSPHGHALKFVVILNLFDSVTRIFCLFAIQSTAGIYLQCAIGKVS